MWLSGRRAVRPDGNYYRSIRRSRPRGIVARGTRMGAMSFLLLVIVIAIISWFSTR